MIRSLLRRLRTQYQLFIFSVLLPIKRGPVYLVLTMGKVGSSTVYGALRSKFGFRVFHLHFLSELLAAARVRHQQVKRWPLPDHLVISKFFLRRWSRIARGDVRVITLVRDPIAFAISEIYQNPDFHSLLTKQTLTSVQDTIQYIKSNVVAVESKSVQYWRRWVELEFLGGLGVSVVDTHHLYESGWAVIQGSYSQVLLIQCERLSNAGGEALSAFCGAELAISNDRKNDRSAKNSVYKEVVDSIRFEESVVRAIYDLLNVARFYSPSQIESFVDRWTMGCDQSAQKEFQS